MRWFKKPTIEFFYTIPGVEYTEPVIPAAKYKHSWFGKAISQMMEAKKQAAFGSDVYMSTTKCPAIVTVMSTGYIVRAWQDITIETNGDGKSVEWVSMVGQKGMFMEPSDAVGFHTEEQLSGFMENWPDNQLKIPVKFCLPVRIKLKKGYKALILPVAYADENRFEAYMGILDSTFPYAPLAINVKWRVLNGKTLIETGTPLAQIIVFRDEKTTYKFSQANPLHMHLYDVLSNNRFVSNYQAIRSLLTKAIS
jgi:hypothetical protein